MKRRAFIGSVAVAAVAVNTRVGLAAAPAPKKGAFEDLLAQKQVVMPPANVQADFAVLMGWLKTNKWLTYIKAICGVDLDVPQAQWHNLLLQVIPPVTELRFEDFGGQQLIEPGFPEFSLLYHVLACPRITPTVDDYPTFAQLDVLENYIFGSVKYTITDSDLQESYAVAVFTYEYRSAYKTPDCSPWAGMVYSRTGIARVGDQPANYDGPSRSYTNKPLDQSKAKQVAVSPARYGVFLAKKASTSDLYLYSEESKDRYGWLTGNERFFLQPIQKLFDGADLLSGGKLLYAESHRNEKLKRLGDYDGITLSANSDKTKPPFIKVSASDVTGHTYTGHDTELVTLTMQGASVLLASAPAALIRPAKDSDGRFVSFKVPAGTHHVNDVKSNRRYTSFRLQSDIGKNTWDYILTEGLYKRYRATRFSAPRDAPLFANIRHELNGDTIRHLSADDDNFEAIVFKGDYDTALFEDNICDGCVTAKINGAASPSAAMQVLLNNVMPAFSLVSAPDFFPLSESYDFKRFDNPHDTSFLEGGIENLSYCRLPVNPNTCEPFDGKPAYVDPPKLLAGGQYQVTHAVAGGPNQKLAFDVSDTMIAILSGFSKPLKPGYKGIDNYQKPELRDYSSNTYLTDSAAFVFAPGWDATYSGKDDGIKYLATFGLGSPFPEDMKLCAAANGMWPVASPDAARTFMGSLDPIPIGIFRSQVTPTAVPLLDSEVGIAAGHPGLADLQLKLVSNVGWDGEQGPFLEKIGDQVMVNFTDIGRSDYVWNAGKDGPGFDMSQLRGLTCTELIARMDALRLCKTTIEGHHPIFSKHWLVSAEKVNDWSNLAAIGIPANLVGSDKNWIRAAQNTIREPGYLYLLTDTIYDKKNETPKWVSAHSKRRRQNVNHIFVCKVSGTKLAWCKLPPEGLNDPKNLEWNYAGS